MPSLSRLAFVFTGALALNAFTPQASDPRLTNRLDRETRDAVDAIIESARKSGVPTEPLVDRALEGASKRATGSQIVSVVRGWADDLRKARQALGPGSPDAEVVAGAHALRNGVNVRQLERLRATRNGVRYAMALDVMNYLVNRGVPADTISPVIVNLVLASASEDQFARLRQDVERDISGGMSAATAASLRGQGLERQIADATTRMDALKKTPGKVKVATVPEAPPNLKISVDGVEQPAGNELSLAPGKHTIQVKADDFEPASQDVEVAFADTKSVSLEMKKVEPPPPPPVAVVEPPPVKPVEPPKPPPPPPRSKVPAYVTLGFAGAGAVVGTIFGVMALGAKSDFDDKPTVDAADKADRNALISDMSYAVAITFGVTGAVLLFSKDSTEETKAANTHKMAPRRAFLAPYAGPTGGGAVGRFTF